MSDPESGWKIPWQDSEHGDRVFFNDDEALVSVELGRRCSDHSERGFCRHCLPRFVAAVDAARRCLDPKAEALIEYVNTAGGQWPETMALVNEYVKPTPTAFAMRFDGATRVTATKTLYTSKRNDYRFDRPVALIDHVTTSRVSDCKHFRSFSVRLKDGIPKAYARRLWEAKLSFAVDGENLVSRVMLKELLGMKEFVFPRPMPDRSCLFAAYSLRDDMMADPDQWHGYMLPNGTQIHVELDEIPGGGGLIQIETSFHLAAYTTKTPARQ